MSPRRKKPCPPLGGCQFKTYHEYEQHMNQIRREAEIGCLLDGPELDYAIAYLRWHEQWEDRLADHGQPEAVTVERNLDVPPSGNPTNQHQLWVHYEDGESKNFSYRLDRTSFGYEDLTELPRMRHLRDVKLAARHIVRPQHEYLKHQSGLGSDFDVHHDKESFQSLLFRFLWEELAIRELSQIKVAYPDNIGTKRFSPEEVSGEWYSFHKREATLVAMTKADHQAWHSAHGKDAEAPWDTLL